MSEQNFGNQREKTILDDYRWAHPHTNAPLPGAKYPATINWAIGNTGKIIFKVNDGVYSGSGDQSYKKKQQEIELTDRNAIFELLLHAVVDPNFIKAQYQIKRKKFLRESGGSGRMSDQPLVEATFTVIRESNGIIKLGFTKSDFKALFEFDSLSDSVLMNFVDGEYRVDHNLNSKIYVKSYIGSIRDFLDGKEFSKYTPRPPKGQTNNGNNNRNSGNNTQDFDDDLPDF